MKTIVLFGSSGGIGKAILDLLSVDTNLIIYPLSSKDIDFSSPDSYDKVNSLLDDLQPDIIINSCGHFGSNTDKHTKIFDVNFGSNWSLIRYYMLNYSNKPVRITMIGSICYNSGKDKYMVYAASKAALFSLWQGACKYFSDSNINIDLINPQRTKTSMTQNRIDPNLQYHEPIDVAEIIIKILGKDTGNTHIDTQFK
jgi:short-subunit dehydrogenase